MAIRTLVVALSLLALPAAAYADLEGSTWHMPKTFENSPQWYFGAVGAVNFSHPDYNSQPEYNAKAAPSGGVIIGTRFTPSFGFDTTFMYLQRTSTANQAIAPGVDADTSLTAKFFQIAPVARFWFNDYLSIGAGGYYAYGLGTIDAQLSSNAFPGGTINQNLSYNDAHATRHDGGLVASAALHMPITEASRFILDGRYTYGLVNMSTDGTVKFRDLQGLMAVALDF
jgi:hypothetical protein